LIVDLSWRNLNAVVVEAEVGAGRHDGVIFAYQREGFCLVSVSFIYWDNVCRRSEIHHSDFLCVSPLFRRL